MNTITVTVTAFDHTFTADLDGNEVTISRDGVWSGTGEFRDGYIEDCAANLMDDSDDTEAVYDALSEALGEALGERNAQHAEAAIDGLGFGLEGVTFAVEASDDGSITASYLIEAGSEADDATGEEAGDAFLVAEEIGAVLAGRLEAAGFRFTSEAGDLGPATDGRRNYAGGEYMRFAR